MLNQSVRRFVSRGTLQLGLGLLLSCGPQVSVNPPPAPPPPPPPAVTNLVWQDEFDGATLDSAKWVYQIGNGKDATGNPGWGNNELQYYTNRPENVSLENGQLVITARREAFPATEGGVAQTFDWTSGRIRTAGKFSRTYGKVEIRAKLPVGQGLWPAFWLLPEDQPGNPYGTWAANGEIDVLESKGGQPNKVWQTIHYGGMWPNNLYSGEEFTFPNAGSIDQFHTYTLEWRSNEMKWLVDGQVVATRTNWWSSKATPPQADTDLTAWPAPFDKPFYVLLNLAVGGNFGGNPDANTPGVGKMIVDYVRWEKVPDENRDSGPRPSMAYPWTPKPARPALADGNLVYNGGFDWGANNQYVKDNPSSSTLPGVTNSNFWTVFFLGQGEQATLSNDATQANSLLVDIKNAGNVNYAVQVRQDNLNIKQQKRYDVEFDAWSSSSRNLMVKVGGGQNRGFAAYSGEQNFALSTTKTRLKFTFDMIATTDAEARLEFNFGAAGVNQVWIDNVSVKEIGDSPVKPIRTPLPDGNLIYNGDFTQDDLAKNIEGVSNTAYWSFWQKDAGRTTPSVTAGEIKLAVTNVDPANNWHIQLNHVDIPLVKSKRYTLSFTGRADSNRTVAVVVGTNGSPFTRYLDATAALTTTSTPFTFTFTAPEDNPYAAFQLLNAVGQGGDNYDLYYTNFKLVQNP
jgi:beta-glucanase (GH16 family)